MRRIKLRRRELISIVLIGLFSFFIFGGFNLQIFDLNLDQVQEIKDKERIDQKLEAEKEENRLIPGDNIIAYESYQDWQKLLEEYNYNISNLLNQVPNIKVVKFPKDIVKMRDIKKKKKIFLSIMRIAAQQANQDILQIRERIKSINVNLAINKSIDKKDMEWIDDMSNLYNVSQDENSLAERINQLLYKVDIIPISLILAQSACESGWGTSRFTREANNIFGEWTYNAEVAGIIPKARPANANYRIRKFATVEESLASYLKNLNRNLAYEKLREIRYKLQRDNQQLDSLRLAEGLLKYSERREEYVQQIKDIIKYNDLKKFDNLMITESE